VCALVGRIGDAPYSIAGMDSFQQSVENTSEASWRRREDRTEKFLLRPPSCDPSSAEVAGGWARLVATHSEIAPLISSVMSTAVAAEYICVGGVEMRE